MSQTNPSGYGGEAQLSAATMPEPEFEAIPLSQTTPEPVQAIETAEFAGPEVLAAPSDDDLDYAWRGDAYGLSVSGLEVGPQDLYAMRPVSERLGSGETTALAQAGEGAYNKLQAQWDWAGSALSSAWQQLSTDPIGALVQGTGAVLSFAGNAAYDTALYASDQVAVSANLLSGGLIPATDALQRNVERTESVFSGVYNIEQAVDSKDYGLAGGLAVEGFEAALLTLATRGRGQLDVPQNESILFGQRRVSPSFSNDPKYPATSGKSINQVVDELLDPNNPLTANDLPITAYRDPASGQLVSANTRTRAALAKAGIEPTNVDIVDIEALPKRQRASLLRRLTEQPVLENNLLPSTKVPVTPSTRDLNILEIIEIQNKAR